MLGFYNFEEPSLSIPTLRLKVELPDMTWLESDAVEFRAAPVE